MIRLAQKFKEASGNRTEQLKENGKIQPTFPPAFDFLTKGRYYDVSDMTDEGDKLIKKIDNESAYPERVRNLFDIQPSNISLEYLTEHGATVEVKYVIGSGYVWYRFTNDIGAVSYGMKAIEKELSDSEILTGI